MQMNFSELISGDTPVLIDFYADWCAPCQMMPPILKEVKSAFGDALRIVKIDSDRNQALSAKYNVRSIPTLMLFHNGEVIWRQAGVVPAPQLIQLLKQHVKATA